MSQAATVQKQPHLWAEINTVTQNPLDFNMDFARAIFNSNSKEAFENILSTKESVFDNIGDDFLIDCLSEFANDGITGCLEDFEKEYAYVHSASSSMTGVPGSLASSASLSGNIMESTDSVFQQNLHDGSDMCPFQCSNKAELEWFPTLNEDPLNLMGTNFDGDPFLIRDDHQSNGGCTVAQTVCEGTSQTLFSSVEVPLKHEASTVSDKVEGFSVENPVPARARSKRSRSGTRVWSAGMITDCNTPTNSVHSTAQPSNIPTFSQSATEIPQNSEGLESMSHTLTCPQTTGSPQCIKKAWKSMKWKKGEDNGQPRRCAHCLTQKTPQWRIGPTGPKTLCNACGVRYKSGRLFPEYRPAKSPTFITCQHSNSHKKVMEMRSKSMDLALSQQRQEGGGELKLRLKLNMSMNGSHL
eukprot:c15980_g1_i1 orf=451-1689(-)